MSEGAKDLATLPDLRTCQPNQATSAFARCAIVGIQGVQAGHQRIRIGDPPGLCFVFAHHQDKLTLCEGSSMDVADCTIYDVEHLGLGDLDLELRSTADRLLERSLLAISELVLWSKAHERAQQSSTFQRQVGRADVKIFYVALKDGRQVVWLNTSYLFRSAQAFLAAFTATLYDDVVIEQQLDPVVKRAMACVDLFSLGFYSESFITLFSLLDALAQNVAKAAFAHKGLDAKAQNKKVKAITRDRLNQFLNNVFNECGAKGLREADAELQEALHKANQLRNDVVHKSLRLERHATWDNILTLLKVLTWLQKNPFGFRIPSPPTLIPTRAEFQLINPLPVAEKSPDAAPA